MSVEFGFAPEMTQHVLDFAFHLTHLAQVADQPGDYGPERGSGNAQVDPGRQIAGGDAQAVPMEPPTRL